MFAYCGNNPATYADDCGQAGYYTVKEANTSVVEEDDDGNVTYKTVIKYSACYTSYDLFAPNKRIVAEVETEVEIIFVIDNRGVAHLDNNQRDDLLLNNDVISLKLAEEMINAAITQVDGAMSGRTAEGVAREIRNHCKWGFLIGIDSITMADIGGTTEGRSDYDYNARGFESFFKIPSVLWEMIFG